MKRNCLLFLWILTALLAPLALLLAGCKDFSFYGVLGDRINDTSLQIAPASASVAASGGVLAFTATGGIPPYSYSVVSGATSGSITPAGSFTAAASGTVIVRVTDSKGHTSDAAVTVTATGAGLQIAPLSVSVLVGGSVTFYVSGGTPPYSFSVLTNNSGAPPMSTEDYTAGLIGGVTDTVQVQDGAAASATASVNVVTAPVADIDYWVPATNFLPATGNGGEAIPGTYNFTIQNDGADQGVQPISWWVFISEDDILGDGDALLSSGSTMVPPAGGGGTVVVSVPSTSTWPAVGGSRWLFVLVAAGDDLNSANNASSGSAVTLIPPDIKYELSGLAPGGGTTAGGPLSGTFDLSNTGSSSGYQPVSWTVYVSTNDTWEDTDPVVDAGSVPGLAAGTPPTPLTISFDGTWPAAAGIYYLIVKAFASDEPASESTTGNELISPSPGISLEVPDYDVPSVTVELTSSTATGGTFAASFTLRNQATVAGGKDVTWTAYASKDDDTLELGTDIVVDSGSYGLPRLGPSPALPQTNISFGGTWPADAGNYFLLVRVAAADEIDAADNLGKTTDYTVVTDQFVDYAVTDVNINPSYVMAGGGLEGDFSLRNVGAVNGGQTVYYQVYASYGDDFLDAGDALVASASRAALNAGVEVTGIGFTGTWPGLTGPCCFIVVATALDDAIPGNNVMALPSAEMVTLVPPVVDYTVSNVNVVLSPLPPEVKTQAVPAGSVSGNFQYANSPALSNGVAWLSYTVYASTDQNLSGDDLPVASGSASPLASGQNGVIPFNNGTWPLAYGKYYLIASVGSPEDSVTSNNWASAADPPISVGIYEEPLTDPPTIPAPGNGDYDLTDPPPCNLNVAFRPGMSVRVNGTFSTTDQDDIFAFNTGTATSLTFHMSWSGTYVMQLNPMSAASTWLTGVYLPSPGSDHITWVWTPDAAGTPRWLDVQNGSSGPPPVAPQNIGPYVLTITAN